MSEGPPVYHVRQPQTLIIMGRAPELWTTPVPDDDPLPTPTAINRLLDLLAQLPPGLDASSRETNHFELVSPHTYGQTLDRLQLLLDLAVAAKAAEPRLRQLATKT